MENIFEYWKQYVIQNEHIFRADEELYVPSVVNIGDSTVILYTGSSHFTAGIWIQSNDGKVWIYIRKSDLEKIIGRTFPEERLVGPVHQHNYIEIGYVVEGTACQSFFGREYQFNQGDFWLVDRNCYHSDIYYPEDLFTVYIGIPSELFDSAYMEMLGRTEIQQFIHAALLQKKNRQFLHFIPRDEKATGAILMEQLLKEIIEQKIGYYDISRGLLARLLMTLSYEYDFSLTSQEKQKINDLMFYEVEQFIQANYRTATIRQLVEHFHYNEDFYNRLIKEYSGFTYSDYLKNIRLKEAEKLLCTTRLTIEQIAEQVGYSNRGSFYRIFSEKYGMSPAKYRKQKSKNT